MNVPYLQLIKAALGKLQPLRSIVLRLGLGRAFVRVVVMVKAPVCYTLSKVLVGLVQWLCKPLPPHLSNVGIWGAVSDKFCNFPKPTIRHLRPFHTVVGHSPLSVA